MPDPVNDDLLPLAGIDKLIHEPARLMIIATFQVVETADFLIVKRQNDFTRGNLPSHMNKLEDAVQIEICKELVDKIPRTLLCITEEVRTFLLSYSNNMKQVLDVLQ